jgi:hypothetical protein
MDEHLPRFTKGVAVRRLISVVVGAVLFGSAGFFAASVASGGGLIGLTTGTTATGTTGVTGQKVTICHRTGSSKHPFRAIRVSQNAVAAHVAHGDHVGPCTPAEQAINKKAKKKAAEQQAESKKAKKKAVEQQAAPAPSEQAKSKKPKK